MYCCAFGGLIGYWVEKGIVKLRRALGTVTSPVEQSVLGVLGGNRVSTNRVSGGFSIASTSVSHRLSMLGSTSLVHSAEQNGFVCCRVGADILRRTVLFVDTLGKSDGG